jgi:serine/threonine-protein kinase/endoribonuclease IRE1
MDLSHMIAVILPFVLLLAAGIPAALSDPLPAIFHPPPSTLSRALSAQASQRLLQHPVGGDGGITKPPNGWEDLELLDTVLVGTIDGGLHALERSTGRRIWSRLIVSKGVVQSELSNEIWRPTKSVADGDQAAGDLHPTADPAYIVDPYDGQLYVQVDADDGTRTVQKLPLTMEQL